MPPQDDNVLTVKYPPGTKAHFLNLLSGTLGADDKRWTLDKPLFCYSAKNQKVFKTPAGSTTDGCSVPRLPWIYAALGGRYHRSGALHDYIYRMSVCPREDCDNLLYEALVSEGCPPIRAEEMYLAVRAFGWQFYGSGGRQA